MDIDHGPFESVRIKDFRNKKVNLEQKNWLADQVNNKINEASVYAKRYNIPCANIRKWAQRKRDGVILKEGKGVYGLLDEISQKSIAEKVSKKRKAQNALQNHDLRILLNEESVETKKRRLMNDLEVNVSDSTVRKYKKVVKCKKKKGQRKSTARIKAEYDPRNSYCEALMFEAFQKDILPELIFNSDATQYFAPVGECSLIKCVYLDDDEDSGPVTYNDDFSEEMGIFVKSFTIITAAGHMGPMVLLFADESMNDNDFKTIKIKGLSHLCDSGHIGYIAFAKTRCANEKFYEWYLDEILIKFITYIKENTNLNEMFCFHSSDGESIILRTIMKQNNIAKLKHNNIIYAKHSASYSAKGNALDAGNYFKATKTRSKNVIKSECLRVCISLRRSIDTALKESVGHIPLNKREKICDAVCRIVVSCQNTCNPNILKNGFAKSGQYLYSAEKQGFNFDAKMRCCTKKLTKDELQHMRQKFPELCETFRLQGNVTEKQLDEAKIVKIDDAKLKDKDARPPHQNRAFVLTDINLQRFYNPSDELKLLAKTTRLEEKKLIKEIKEKQQAELKEAVKKLKERAKEEKVIAMKKLKANQK
jgi:hypothetical protein